MSELSHTSRQARIVSKADVASPGDPPYCRPSYGCNAFPPRCNRAVAWGALELSSPFTRAEMTFPMSPQDALDAFHADFEVAGC
jgi:hypothetical protein